MFQSSENLENIPSREKILNQMKNCVCKIKIGNITATGFFCKIPIINMIFFMTNFNVITEEYLNENKEITISKNDDKESTVIDLTIEREKYFSKKYGITAVEIKEKDEVKDFLEIDDNLLKNNEENYYKDKSIYILDYSFGKNICVSFGKLNKIDEYDITYICSTEVSSLGSPILNLENNKVIGIHKQSSINYNKGTLLKYPLNDIIQKYNKNNINNIIIGEINLNNDDINKDIQIINSFENFKRIYQGMKFEDEDKCKNEKEIKENIEIKINGKKIEFTYNYKFEKEGKYQIEYLFKNNLTNTCYMFTNCKSITNLNLSNFNTQNVTNMENMFWFCSSLKNLNLSNFNTQNTTNMRNMFSCCRSLNNINLSNFNTENVTNMSNMFNNCDSLTNLNLSNFNTQNVTNMSNMFNNCPSLINLNLSNFNTKNVENMEGMFCGCDSLSDLNLSNFNTQNVTNMGSMFYDCKSLINLNLSNFNTQNVKNMSCMFTNCDSLSNLNLSNFNTQNVTNLSYMFADCKSLTNLNLSNFNTQNVTNTSYMFENCYSLINLNLSNFNAQNMKNMIRMFADCKSLTNLNLSNFKAQNEINIGDMFWNCNSLTKKNIITNDNKILEEFERKD